MRKLATGLPGVQPERMQKSWLWLGLALLVELSLLSLADWQWRRYQQRLTEQAVAAARPPNTLTGTYLPLTAALTQQPNPTNPEESGWRVLALLQTAGSLVVIDRGYAVPRWLADGVPDFTGLAPPTGLQTVQGVWVPLPTRRGWLRGPDTTTHPRLLAFLNPAMLTSASVAPQQLVLTSPDTANPEPMPSAPPMANPLRHLSYMLQWLLMAVVFPLLCWVVWRRRAA
ncbi:MAG: hypothetical protein INF43_00930 [Alphaproteobacteria bacterium]|nr:hypothetical protein [Alphaproteobacteria bacterium]